MRVVAISLLVLLTLALVAPSIAQRGKARYASERRSRLSDPITDELGLALKVGFHSGCSGCLAAQDDFNWCVHPDNDGVGACVPGACSSYNYNTIFNIQNKARAVDTTKNFKDGSYICSGEREPAFRTRDGKARTSYGVQDFNNLQENGFMSSLSYMTGGQYYSDVNTFSHGVIPNFCNLAEDTVIDRTQGGPDFLINAGYEHCLMANSDLRPVLERECGPESECFGQGLIRFPGKELPTGKVRGLTEDQRRQIPIGFPFFLFDTSRFFYYQCDQLRMNTQEQQEHYNWVVAAIRSVSCANDCHTYGVPTSGVCQHSCTRINEAYTNYRRAYGAEFGFFGPGALVSQFETVEGDGDAPAYKWILSDYVCVPDDTPMCQDVDLKDTVSDYFRSRISPETMTYEEQQLCLEFNLFDLLK